MQRLNHEKAAILYWAIFAIGESDLDPLVAIWREEEIYRVLRLGEWPRDVIFDNEGEPHIEWEAFGAPKEWDWDTWISNELDGGDSDGDYLISPFLAEDANMDELLKDYKI